MSSLGRSGRIASFLVLPAAVVAMLSFVAFRHSATIVLPQGTPSNPLQIPPGWPAPPVPADNAITPEKFVLGRQLFYETGLSGDNNTSCGSCHNPRISFAARGPHGGAFGDTSKPARNVPRLLNLAYDTVFTWDGHIH